MNTQAILELIDQQIAKLQQAKNLFGPAPALVSTGSKRGRPKGSTNATKKTVARLPPKKTKRVMSPEGKARIAAAQKARWAATKATPATVAKKASAKTA